MSRVLALQALQNLPSDIKKTIIAKVFPTFSQLVSRLRKQAPPQRCFLHLDVAIISFVHSDKQKITFARLVGSERSWVIGRCKLFCLDHQDVRTVGGRGLILLKDPTWVCDEDTEVCKLMWCKRRWRYRCNACDLATNLDSKQIFVRKPSCPMCQQVDRPICALPNTHLFSALSHRSSAILGCMGSLEDLNIAGCLDALPPYHL